MIDGHISSVRPNFDFNYIIGTNLYIKGDKALYDLLLSYLKARSEKIFNRSDIMIVFNFDIIEAKNNFFDTVDLIIPVPISKKRKRDRGYNQSEYIAKGILENAIKENKIQYFV